MSVLDSASSRTIESYQTMNTATTRPPGPSIGCCWELSREGATAWPSGAPIVACFGTRSEDAFTLASVLLI